MFMIISKNGIEKIEKNIDVALSLIPCHTWKTLSVSEYTSYIRKQTLNLALTVF